MTELKHCLSGYALDHSLASLQQSIANQVHGSLSGHPALGDNYLATESSSIAAGCPIAFAFPTWLSQLRPDSIALYVRYLSPFCAGSFSHLKYFCKNSSSQPYTVAITQFIVTPGCVLRLLVADLVLCAVPPLLASSS